MMSRLLGAIGIVGIILLFLPLAVLALHAGSFTRSLSNPQNLSALRTTLTSGILALAVDVLLGVPLSWFLGRRVRPGWQRFWGTCLIIPMLMPPLVLGLVLAYLAGPVSPITLTNTFPGLVLAEVYESLPFFVFAAWGYLRTIPRSLEEDAWALGKSPRETFWYVLWPLSVTGFAVAAAMAWARIVGAFGGPIVVAYHPSALPVQIWIALEEQGLPAALGLSLWLIVAALPLPVWLNWRYSHVNR
ncbi:ABC transporter permease subunit [Sulfobacillus harzensis]|uniref:ABC transporter permease subunit n=1 Tax=Sulfobacillus harzensis TaxID=2729629 RepID=A0A7Y0Q1P7_9FIRM|nr:ABC transporter permease subunit [Sulfobacillus harzensis]NMP21677.1 ABC transporter permease subunit [Sulfobacillus harzensis]